MECQGKPNEDQDRAAEDLASLLNMLTKLSPKLQADE